MPSPRSTKGRYARHGHRRPLGLTQRRARRIHGRSSRLGPWPRLDPSRDPLGPARGPEPSPRRHRRRPPRRVGSARLECDRDHLIGGRHGAGSRQRGRGGARRRPGARHGQHRERHAPSRAPHDAGRTATGRHGFRELPTPESLPTPKAARPPALQIRWSSAAALRANSGLSARTAARASASRACSRAVAAPCQDHGVAPSRSA